MTTSVWQKMYLGVPKVRARRSAQTPNQSSPNVDAEAPVRDEVAKRLRHESERLVDDPLDRLLGHGGETVHMPSASPARRQRVDERVEIALVVVALERRAHERAAVPALDRHLDAMTS